MTVQDYIAKKIEQKTTLCAAILYPDGEIKECIKGHLTTIIDELGTDIWNEIPKDESPLFWLIAYTGVVLIDYENQIFSEKLTVKQEEALKEMYDAGIIINNGKMIHWGNRIFDIAKDDESRL